MTKTTRKTKIPLIRKTSRTFLGVSAVLMVLSTIVLFFYLRNLLRDEVEEELFSTQARIITSLQNGLPPQTLPPEFEVSKVSQLAPEVLKDTLIFDPSQNEMEEFRELTSFKSIKGQNYRITVRNLIVESEDVLVAVIVSYTIIILSVLAFLFFFNKSRNQRVWQPFFSNLQAMQRFSLTSSEPIGLMESDILEFSELNHEIQTLTKKVRADYLNLKNYTEDVSHEMQTPLSIIQAKIEGMMNTDGLNDVQFEHLSSIQKDLQRLAQMNKRLALLTKIENRQFSRLEEIDMADLLKQQIENFNEISEASFVLNIKNGVRPTMDPYLAEVLCNNLLSNALKYNGNNKTIGVELEGNGLSVSNSGDRSIAHPEKLFTRFYRESNAQKSTGIGLAIVKRICDHYGFQVGYEFLDGNHVFSVNFG